MAISYDSTAGHHVAAGKTTAGTSVTATVTVVAGQTVAVAVIFPNNITVSSITDTGGSSYTLAAAVNNGTGLRTELWSTGAGAALASTSVTIHVSSSSVFAYAIDQYSGVAALGTNTTATGNGTAQNISLTTQDANNFVVAGVGVQSGATTESWSATGGTNLRASGSNTSVGASQALADETAATASTITLTTNVTTGDPWAAAALELRSTSGGGVTIHGLPALGVGL